LVGFHICMQMNVGDSFAKLKIPRINYLYLFRSKWEVGTSNLVCISPCTDMRIEGVLWNKHRCQNECDPTHIRASSQVIVVKWSHNNFRPLPNIF
jgi:hypothetical protein